MPFSKFIIFPIFVALQAAILMLMTPYIKIGPTSLAASGLITWISFQSWAMYFLGGCTLKMAGKTIIGYTCGIIAAIAIFTLFGVFSGFMTGSMSSLALPLAVFIVVIPIMCAEKVEILNFIPAWFMGAAVFFALNSMYAPDVLPEGVTNATYAKTMWDYVLIATPEMIACVVGLGFGVCTVSFRKWYEKLVMPQTEEETESVKKSA